MALLVDISRYLSPGESAPFSRRPESEPGYSVYARCHNKETGIKNRQGFFSGIFTAFLIQGVPRPSRSSLGISRQNLRNVFIALTKKS